MKFLNSAFLILAILIFSCDSQEEQLEEAKKIHNEALAIFADTRPLLKDVTEARRELTRRTGLTLSDSVRAFETSIVDTTLQANQTDTAGQEGEQDQGIMENIPKFSDTTATKEVIQAFQELDQVQNDLLLWMRNIYRVPGYKGIYEDEKTSADPAIAKDYDANMLLSDMQFIEMPEDATAEEVYEKQVEMKEDILRIQVDIKRATENARQAYIKYN